MSSDKNKGLFLGFLVGGAIGAILALLYAPKSGRELRRDIKEKADGYIEDAEKYVSDAKEKAKNLINEGKKKSEKIIDEAKTKSEAILKDAEKLFKDVKQKTGDIVHGGKETIGSEGERIKGAFKAGVDAYKETKNNPNA